MAPTIGPSAAARRGCGRRRRGQARRRRHDRLSALARRAIAGPRSPRLRRDPSVALTA